MSVRAGEVDWVALWETMHAAVEATSPRNPGEDVWRHRADRFDRVRSAQTDGAFDAVAAGVLATDVVADLGAGTGRHVLPLSRRCARVIAVEPSPSMRAKLDTRLADEQPSNVTVIAREWPCAIPAVDVAYSSHVLYAIADAARFVREMTAAARRTCYLVLGLRAPADRLGPLWRALHGEDRPRRPAALEALALLHQLGYAASLRVISGSERPHSFAPTVDELDELCHRMRVPADDAGRSRVRDAMDRLYPRPSADAPWDLGTGAPSALIEWPGAAR